MILKAIRARVGFGSGTESSTGIIKELADIEILYQIMEYECCGGKFSARTYSSSDDSSLI